MEPGNALDEVVRAFRLARCLDREREVNKRRVVRVEVGERNVVDEAFVAGRDVRDVEIERAAVECHHGGVAQDARDAAAGRHLDSLYETAGRHLQDPVAVQGRAGDFGVVFDLDGRGGHLGVVQFAVLEDRGRGVLQGHAGNDRAAADGEGAAGIDRDGVLDEGRGEPFRPSR